MEKKPTKKRFYPYLAAIAMFILISFFYCSPVFQGKVIYQSDVLQAVGMQKEMKDFHDQTGDYTLWTNSMFGGMPTYQVGKAGVPDYNIFTPIGKFLRFNLPPYSVDIIFLYLLGFFILLIALEVNPWLAIGGAIAFAFTSYNITIIIAGHVNKAFVIGLIPVVLAGVLLIFKRKYIIGALLAIIGFGAHLHFNHVQMTYYMMICLLIFFIVEFIYSLKSKELNTFFIASSIVAGSFLVALIPNISGLLTTYEYSKDTIRGGSELTQGGAKKTSGLDKDYAYSWSYDKMETFTLLIPNFKGGASGGKLTESSEMYKTLIDHGYPRAQAKDFIRQAPTYWGEQMFTYGPVYFGAVICFLFVLGLYLVDKKYVWWIAVMSVIAIFLSWGKHFEWFSDIFFYYFPMYNKFRSVSSILVIPSILFPLLAFLGLKNIMDGNIGKNDLFRYLKYSVGITGGIVMVFLLIGTSLFSFSGSSDEQFRSAGYPDWLMNAIVNDRISLFRKDAFRSLVLILLSSGAIWLFIKEKLKKEYFIAAICLIILVDMWPVAKRYLNNDDFQIKKQAQSYQPTNADLQILKDKDPDFRVFNLTSNPFAETHTSYFHKSLGGYHAAKLRRYQELIEHHLSKNNMNVINMLNTKYFIVPDENKQPIAQQNPGAIGNAWFVNEIKVVDNADEEIAALTDFNPRRTAVLDKQFLDKLPEVSKLKVDSVPVNAKIRLASYAPNKLTYSYEASQPLFAVFSEIYYNEEKGWNAYLDGKKVPHVRVNYVLRGMALPDGMHQIEFRFEPQIFYKAQKAELYSSILAGIVILGLIGLLIKKKLKSSVS
jgi:hypothetical protein